MTTKIRAEVQERRQKAYELYLEGFNETQIGTLLHVSQRTISTALSVIRRQNAKWYQQNKKLDARFESKFKEHEDRLMHVYNEAFQNYRLVPALPENPLKPLSAKISLLQVARAALHDVAELYGLRAPNIDELAFMETLDNLLKELEELKQKAKVKPLA
jgi:predicted transcriptional regulator